MLGPISNTVLNESTSHTHVRASEQVLQLLNLFRSIRSTATRWQTRIITVYSAVTEDKGMTTETLNLITHNYHWESGHKCYTTRKLRKTRLFLMY